MSSDKYLMTSLRSPQLADRSNHCEPALGEREGGGGGGGGEDGGRGGRCGGAGSLRN